MVRPEVVLSLLGFTVLDRGSRVAGDYTLVFVIAASMASFNIGVYYALAAFNDMKQFFLWTVPFRLVTFTVFTMTALTHLAPPRFILVGAWEGLGALATGLALHLERPNSSSADSSKIPIGEAARRKK